jgi:hypothetical protein
MPTIKTMWKAIFQNKLKIYKKSLLCGLISQTSPEMPPKMAAYIYIYVREANWKLSQFPITITITITISNSSGESCL